MYACRYVGMYVCMCVCVWEVEEEGQTQSVRTALVGVGERERLEERRHNTDRQDTEEVITHDVKKTVINHARTKLFIIHIIYFYYYYYYYYYYYCYKLLSLLTTIKVECGGKTD